MNNSTRRRNQTWVNPIMRNTFNSFMWCSLILDTPLSAITTGRHTRPPSEAMYTQRCKVNLLGVTNCIAVIHPVNNWNTEHENWLLNKNTFMNKRLTLVTSTPQGSNNTWNLLKIQWCFYQDNQRAAVIINRKEESIILHSTMIHCKTAHAMWGKKQREKEKKKRGEGSN